MNQDWNKNKYSDAKNINRTDLSQVIPLSHPLSISIDVCDICNFACKFCEAHSSEKTRDFKWTKMDMPLFDKVVEDLTPYQGKLKKFSFCGYGEPTINPLLPDMVQKLRKSQGEDLWIDIVTNGSLLTEELCERLSDSGVNRIKISIEALSDEAYLEVTGKPVKYHDIKENVARLYQYCKGKAEVFVKIVDVSIKTKEDKEKFMYDFEDICDRIFIDRIVPLWADYNDEIKEGFHLEAVEKMEGLCNSWKKVCTSPFYSCLIRVNGDIAPCGADWERKNVIGNLYQNHFDEIWNGEEMYSFWKEQLKGNRMKLEVCKNCERLYYETEDNIDEAAAALLEKF